MSEGSVSEGSVSEGSVSVGSVSEGDSSAGVCGTSRVMLLQVYASTCKMKM